MRSLTASKAGETVHSLQSNGLEEKPEECEPTFIKLEEKPGDLWKNSGQNSFPSTVVRGIYPTDEC